MKRKSILFLYLLLLAIGLAYETQSLTEGWMSGSQYGIVGLSTLILLVYALPAVWALFHFAKKWKLSWVPVLFSLLGGGFVAGWLSSFANTYFHDMIQAIAPNSDFWNQYESAIAAPLFEEPFKLIPIFFVLYLFSVRRIKSIFLLAIASGLGFQIVEDFAYIRQDLPEGFSYTVSGILGRVANAPMSHWVYTGLVMLGLFLIVQASRGRKDLRLAGWGYLVAGFGLPCDFSKDLPGAGEIDLEQVDRHTESQAFVDRLQAFNSFFDEGDVTSVRKIRCILLNQPSIFEEEGIDPVFDLIDVLVFQNGNLDMIFRQLVDFDLLWEVDLVEEDDAVAIL